MRQVNVGIIVKEENFKEANYIVAIKSKTKNKFLPEGILDKMDYLYLNIKDVKLIKNPIDFKIDTILIISKVHIVASIEKIEKEN